MSARLSITTLFLFATAAPSHAGFATLWTELLAVSSYSETRAAAVGASGDVATIWRTGRVEGFPGGLRYRDLAFARIHGDGGLRWLRSFESNGAVVGTDIAFDPSENVILCGHLIGQLEYYGLVGAIDSVATTSALVAKIDSNALLAWHRTMVGSGQSEANGVAVDDDGSLIVVGWFNGTVDFGGGAVTSTGGRDVFVTRLHANGDHAWTRTFGGAQDQVARDVAIEADHDIVMLGEFQGFIDLGDGVRTSAGLADVFFARLDANGNHEMSGAFGTTANDAGISIDVGSDDAPVITGWHNAPLVLGGALLPVGYLVAKFDAAGSHRWSEAVSYASIDGLTVGPNDYVYWYDIDKIVVNDANGSFVSEEPIATLWVTFIAIEVDSDWRVVVSGMEFKGENDYGYLFDVVVRKLAFDNPNTVAITHFDAEWNGKSVVVRAAFNSDLSVGSVNVYRARGDGELRRIERVEAAASPFEYVDDEIVPGETYRYQVGVVDPDGEFLSTTAIVRTHPLETSLGQNQPNPFNPSTRIPFATSERGHVTLAIYDARGRRVRTLIDGAMPAGKHSVDWDGRDDRGVAQSSGVYFCRMEASKRRASRKMVLLK